MIRLTRLILIVIFLVLCGVVSAQLGTLFVYEHLGVTPEVGR